MSAGIVCHIQRSGVDPRMYLLSLSIGLDEADGIGSHPQARAVVDDFGNLVIVRGWR